MGSRHSFKQVDAFASFPFEGNSAAVYRVDAFPEDDLMLKIAREHNLSETAWFMPDDSGEADFVLRWFTPTVEVEMCGHATLAAGHVVLSEDADKDKVLFNTTKGAGVLEVERDGEGRYLMSLPAWQSDRLAKPELVAALGRIPSESRVTKNAAEDSFMVVFEDEQTIRSLTPDFKALAAIGNVLVIATAPADAASDYEVVSRVFAPGAGIDEDPVTGSAHAMLTPYWADRLGKDTFEAYQASQRGGRIACRLDGDRAILGGGCVGVMEGELLLP